MPAFCAQCGSAMGAGARFCGQCGTAIFQPGEDQDRASPNSVMPAVPVVLSIALALFVVAAVILGFMWWTNRDDEASQSTTANASDELGPSGEEVDTVVPATSPSGTGRVDLSVYVGKYPTDVSGGGDLVNGLEFNAHPAVRRAVASAAGSSRITNFLLDPPGPIGPIEAQRGYVISGACEAHNCNGQNASLVITPDGERAQVCYFNDAESSLARWYADGRQVRTTAYCPGYDGSGEVRLDREFIMRPPRGVSNEVALDPDDSGAVAADSTPPRLTPINGATANQCRWSLDQRGSVIVAYQGQANGWRMGINNKTIIFDFSDFTYDPLSGANIFRSRNRSIFVRATPLRRITTPQHDIDELSISVAIDGSTTSTVGYRLCPEGD